MEQRWVPRTVSIFVLKGPGILNLKNALRRELKNLEQKQRVNITFHIFSNPHLLLEALV
jgi:hypothetical protein